jgi:hypothetical protein
MYPVHGEQAGHVAVGVWKRLPGPGSRAPPRHCQVVDRVAAEQREKGRHRRHAGPHAQKGRGHVGCPVFRSTSVSERSGRHPRRLMLRTYGNPPGTKRWRHLRPSSCATTLFVCRCQMLCKATCLFPRSQRATSALPLFGLNCGFVRH